MLVRNSRTGLREFHRRRPVDWRLGARVEAAGGVPGQDSQEHILTHTIFQLLGPGTLARVSLPAASQPHP